MTVEVRPLGDKCNIQCKYCYQQAARESQTRKPQYDVDAVIGKLEEIGVPFSLFGGEVMLTKRSDLRRLLEFGYDRHGTVGMQTNGTLVREADLALFSSYSVNVGVSIDGPGEMNDERWGRHVDLDAAGDGDDGGRHRAALPRWYAPEGHRYLASAQRGGRTADAALQVAAVS
ncbi:radical SAM protein [Paraburkholderia atlantica]|uniref:radical SAM protein n=1 Tax=Paraburkholderia atlantica TaxID=2654982 RepID=UPI003D1E082A